MSERSNATEEKALDMLREQFSDPTLRSSTRVLILISLALNRKMTFVGLLTLTGVGKGSLSNHLEKLESSGFITISTKETFRKD